LVLAPLALVAVNLVAPKLPEASVNGGIAFIALVSIPLATATVYFLADVRLPTQTLLITAVAAAVIAAVLIHIGLGGTPATLAKLFAASCLGLALASLLVRPLEVVMIALVIAAVDIYSVAVGPTHVIVEHHQAVLDAFTLAFHPPGSYGAAQIGASDFVFFAVFTGAAIRLHLRRRLTWLATTASFGVTLGLSVGFDTALPALPLLSLSFLLANADLLLTGRGRSGSPERE
jgi:hypothetical protein